MVKRTIDKSKTSFGGFKIGDQVAFTEIRPTEIAPYLSGVGVVVGFANQFDYPIVVEPKEINIGGDTFFTNYFEDIRKLRPFRAGELKLLSSPTPEAKKAELFRVVSADGATASSRTWDRYEDALRDAEKRAAHDPAFREFQVVSVVARAKAEKMKIIKYQRGGVIVTKS